VRENGLKGRRFTSLAEVNRCLQQWEQTVADTRIHGTTRKQVAQSFEEERPHLQPLPGSLFPCYQEGRRNVHRDSFVEVARSYYEVPPEYIGCQLWVRWDSRTVRVFNERFEQVAMHARIEEGRFSRTLGTGGHSQPVIASCQHWISRAGLLGDSCAKWSDALYQKRGPEALRSIIGLCNLIKQHSSMSIEAACGKAIEHNLWRLRDIRNLLSQGAEQTSFSFTENHPLIRNLSAYSDFITASQTHQHQHQHQDTSS
jgi:hypothetical protein